ncbi:lantibiotic dehydratase family protein [Streptomyces sp. B1866]|uniref:lantibiotic dehydratase family protein n=1 Tax=Streptomyces sp. B1866 TaxID=3075431 RepID=UPI00288DD324|nr:lantibiotic dehydratase family protein [Streptomyces sp. B1866]MDT3397671.1 lantibiotic dehydratase family protein [Streptomyces sp. B1866]
MPRGLDLSGESVVVGGRAWLAEVWQREEIREALSAASPDLCRRIDDIVARSRPDPRRVRRAVLSLAFYLLRWQQRPTPFGLFAGVAPVRIGPEGQVSWGGKHHTAARADADWLADIVARLERCPELLERLLVVANDVGQIRGDRYVVPGPPADGRGHRLAPVEVSVRHTRPVAVALDAARAPVRYGALRTELGDRFPTATAEMIDSLLGGLMAQNVLITSLRAPMTCLDALGHVCAQLDAAEAQSIPGLADLVRQLYAIRDELTPRSPLSPSPAWAGAAGRMRALSDVAPVPLVVDTALDCDVQIPDAVAREAREAVGVLSRLSPFPFGYPQWRDYHSRFRARYGVGAVVPVLDLVSDSGLGLPAGYLGSAHRRAPRELTERDEKLLALIQQAALDGQDEIVLTEPVIAELAGGADIIPVPRAEVSVEIHAASADALARGAFRLVVTGTPRPGSSMAGRFATAPPPTGCGPTTAPATPPAPAAPASGPPTPQPTSRWSAAPTPA